MRRFILSLVLAALAAALLVTALPAGTGGVSAPGRLNFGRFPVSGGNTTANLTIKNNTGSTIYYYGQSGLAAPFSLSYNGCSSVADGSSCIMTFYFVPTAAQKSTTTVTLYWQQSGGTGWAWRTETLFVGTGYVPKH